MSETNSIHLSSSTSIPSPPRIGRNQPKGTTNTTQTRDIKPHTRPHKQ